LPPDSRFCNKCGTPITPAATSAEYKQVTVLFADVVHSMDIAAAVGPERLREIMANLVDRAAAVVKRYGGTVDKFTGDGIMAVFGAPVALEDHAVRACLAALGIQDEATRLATEVQDRDGVDLRLRVGLNSGQVIAGELGSGALGYTTIGEQVGMAQRMESIAAPGGVMLSASTARLVDGAAALGGLEMVHIKGADEPVVARRLLGMGDQPRGVGRAESNLVGRRWEMSAVEGLLGRAIDGHGAVVGVVGSPGIGKSRVVRELAAMASDRSVDVFTAFCESHTSQVPFHAVARLLRAAFGVGDLDAKAARTRVHDRLPDADPEDLALFDDLLGIADPNAPLPAIDPDARRRRLTALVNATSLARETPAIYVVEDAHWIDEVSESMLAEFLTVIPQTPSLVLVTYRPEYHGALTQVAGAHTVALAPLHDSETAALVSELLGPDPSVCELRETIAERAAGNPFFAEEIARELAERGVLRGSPSAYVSTSEITEVSVPATLQATIAARIDRLDAKAKRALSAAAVIGTRFKLDLLTVLGVEPVVDELVATQLIDQVSFTGKPEYVFHHPLVRAVAYEAQLKSDRAELHRRVAAAIEQQEPDSVDENAALIAEHRDAAGDLQAAFDWHMRAGAWSANRDIIAAQRSWERARKVADALAGDHPNRLSMRIAPRTLLCGSSWRRFHDDISARFEELRELCAQAGDKASLAVGTAGLVMEQIIQGRVGEASRLASECMALVESLEDPSLIVQLSFALCVAKIQAADWDDALRWSHTVIEFADQERVKANLLVGSPVAIALVFRGVARWRLGRDGWRKDLDSAVAMARTSDPVSQAVVIAYKYAVAGPVLPADDAALAEIGEALEVAERSSEDIALVILRLVQGATLVRHASADRRRRGFDLLSELLDICVKKRYTLNIVPSLKAYAALTKAARGDLDGAIEQLRSAADESFDNGNLTNAEGATVALVETLLARGGEDDVAEADVAMRRLPAVLPQDGCTQSALVMTRLRALIVRARGDEPTYRELEQSHRAMATSLGYGGRMIWPEAMP
jgi:class 3 adenylate cyclase